MNRTPKVRQRRSEVCEQQAASSSLVFFDTLGAAADSLQPDLPTSVCPAWAVALCYHALGALWSPGSSSKQIRSYAAARLFDNSNRRSVSL